MTTRRPPGRKPQFPERITFNETVVMKQALFLAVSVEGKISEAQILREALRDWFKKNALVPLIESAQLDLEKEGKDFVQSMN